MKAFFSKILQQVIIQNFLALIASLYIRLVFKTGKWEFKNKEIIETYVAEQKPFILSFWHGHLLMMACIWKWKIPAYVLISNHRDGKIISKTMQHFGIRTIAGSTNKQGFEAGRQIQKILKQKSVIAITPDGPRGPREEVSRGILQMARLAQVDVIPIAYSSTPMKRLRTWDHFRLAWPFCRGVFVIGNPVKHTQDIEKLRMHLQQEMNTVVSKADAFVSF